MGIVYNESCASSIVVFIVDAREPKCQVAALYVRKAGKRVELRFEVIFAEKRTKKGKFFTSQLTPPSGSNNLGLLP